MHTGGLETKAKHTPKVLVFQIWCPWPAHVGVADVAAAPGVIASAVISTSCVGCSLNSDNSFFNAVANMNFISELYESHIQGRV